MGAPGQQEIDLRYADALSTADNIMTFRHVIKEVAMDQGFHASFMPKPFTDHPGSGMHTLLVMGHTKCGAVTAAVDGKALPGNMPAFMNMITPALAGLAAPTNGADGKPNVTPAAEANVRWQMKQTLARSEMLTKAVKERKLTVLCAMYDVDTGEVRFLD